MFNKLLIYWLINIYLFINFLDLKTINHMITVLVIICSSFYSRIHGMYTNTSILKTCSHGQNNLWKITHNGFHEIIQIHEYVELSHINIYPKYALNKTIKKINFSYLFENCLYPLC